MAKDPQLYEALLGDEENADLYPVKPTQVRRTKAIKKGTSCLCKIFLIAFALASTMFAVITIGLYFFMKDAVQHLTVTTPHAPFPIVSMKDSELDAVIDRMDNFMDLLEAHKVPSEPLVITQHEINGMLCHSDYLRGNIMITLNEGSIKEEYSLPMWMLPGGSDRFFVGADSLKLDNDNQKISVDMDIAANPTDWFDGPLLAGQLSYLVMHHKNEERILEMYLDKGIFFGQEAPQDYIDKHENLLEHMFDDDDCEHMRAIMEGVEHVEIQQGQIVVYPLARE